VDEINVDVPELSIDADKLSKVIRLALIAKVFEFDEIVEIVWKVKAVFDKRKVFSPSL
jgi:hypothetical protein